MKFVLSMPFANGALLTMSAIFIYDWRAQLLMLLMLCLPFFDKAWSLPRFNFLPVTKTTWVFIVKLFAFVFLLVYLAMPGSDWQLLLSVIFLVALPEEWFFRAYMMARLEGLLSSNEPEKRSGQVAGMHNSVEKSGSSGLYANALTSMLFTALHLPVQGVWGLGVFLPSMFFGWVYQRTNDLVFLILLHASFNIFYLTAINYITVN